VHTAQAFFGTNRLDFSVVKVMPGVPDVTRVYERFTDVIEDTIDARVRTRRISRRLAARDASRMGA
jgi:hypothetical protein